jgi:transposase
LLRASFRPQAELAALRAYLRQRDRLLDYAAAHIQHMQKALMQMNLQLHHIVSDITGVTGMSIIRAIVAGERDPKVLASQHDRRCHASVETVSQALIGNYREEHVFALTQAVELYDVYQTKVLTCDTQIEAILKRLKQNARPPKSKLLPARRRARQSNEPAFDVRGALHAILGVDLTQINGLGPSLALKLVGECGTNLTAWPSAKHFTSWLGLAPHNTPVARYRRRNPAHRQPGSITVASRSRTPRSDGHGSWRVLPAVVGARWKSQGDRRH